MDCTSLNRTTNRSSPSKERISLSLSMSDSKNSNQLRSFDTRNENKNSSNTGSHHGPSLQGANSKESSNINGLSDAGFQLSPTVDGIIISPTPSKDKSLECDRIQSLKNYINMRFIRGDFKDIQCNDISIESNCKQKQIADSDFYPSAEVVCTRDNMKSLSTTTTANRCDKENSGRLSNINGLVSHTCLSKLNTEEKENIGKDETFSPPLARQLFTKHGLFEIEELEDDKQGEINLQNFDWLEEEEKEEKKFPSLQKITEAPDSHSSSSPSRVKEISKEQIKKNKENLCQVNQQSLKIGDNKDQQLKQKPSIKLKIRLSNDKIPVELQKLNEDLEISVELTTESQDLEQDSTKINEISQKVFESLRNHFEIPKEKSKLKVSHSSKNIVKEKPKVVSKNRRHSKTRRTEIILEDRPLKRKENPPKKVIKHEKHEKKCKVLKESKTTISEKNRDDSNNSKCEARINVRTRQKEYMTRLSGRRKTKSKRTPLAEIKKLSLHKNGKSKQIINSPECEYIKGHAKKWSKLNRQKKIDQNAGKAIKPRQPESESQQRTKRCTINSFSQVNHKVSLDIPILNPPEFSTKKFDLTSNSTEVFLIDSHCIEDKENQFVNFSMSKTNPVVTKKNFTDTHESTVKNESLFKSQDMKNKIHLPRKTISRQENHASVKDLISGHKRSKALQSSLSPTEFTQTPNILKKNVKKKLCKRRLMKSSSNFECLNHFKKKKMEASAELNKLKYPKKRKNSSKHDRHSAIHVNKTRSKKIKTSRKAVKNLLGSNDLRRKMMSPLGKRDEYPHHKLVGKDTISSKDMFFHKTVSTLKLNPNTNDKLDCLVSIQEASKLLMKGSKIFNKERNVASKYSRDLKSFLKHTRKKVRKVPRNVSKTSNSSVNHL
ncbi:unnamed protein product [Moneuplotes crassus]|uniref:Uncharacterized protein n=1 Tax=Euplotes crassus TaxID=5936 RepID=A0AAD1UME2_EUPCR|nr:unnamed protein product [Moneuplotes crassus]